MPIIDHDIVSVCLHVLTGTWATQEAFLGLWWLWTLESELSIGTLNGKSGLCPIPRYFRA